MTTSMASKGAPLPVHVLTGFLGSGKTTLLNRLLADPSMKDTMVLINEFGDAGLDHLLVRELAEDVVLLSSGCMCCTVRDDLVARLAELRLMMEASEIPPFARAVIETTGLADPAPIMQALLTDPLLAGRYTLSQVIATADAVNGEATLEAHREARDQVALADIVVLTKTDLVAAERTAIVQTRITELNAGACLLKAARGRIEGAKLLEGTASPDHWHAPVRGEPPRRRGHGYRAYHADSGRHHSPDIVTFTVRQPAPVDRSAFVEWLELLLFNRGASILRVKGLIALTDVDGPTVVQGVQHVLYPLDTLPDWPQPTQQDGWLVFIARDLSCTAVEHSLRGLCAESRAGAAIGQ